MENEFSTYIHLMIFVVFSVGSKFDPDTVDGKNPAPIVMPENVF